MTDNQEKTTAIRLMFGAQAHQRASVYCMDNPAAKPPNIDSFFFNVVSMELILMSVEQSLRLLLLLRYSIIRSDTGHTPNVLYGDILKRNDGGASGIRSDIVDAANAVGGCQGITPIDEREIRKCLRKHRSSYTNFRHFQLDKQGRLNPDFGFEPRDVQVLHCLALGLIKLNMDEMRRHRYEVPASMRRVPESDMTDE